MIAINNPVYTNESNQIKSSYDILTETRTRDEILNERRLRKKSQKIAINKEKLQQKAADLRVGQLSDKLKIIKSKVDEEHTSNAERDQLQTSHQKHKQLRSIQINLLNLIEVGRNRRRIIKGPDKSARKLTSKSTIVRRNKGKIREVPKKKYMTRLKRSILMSRKLRRNCSLEVGCPQNVFEEDLLEINNLSKAIDKLGICSALTFSVGNIPAEDKTTNSIDKLAICPNEITNSANSIRFSRKFRPYCENLPTLELCRLTESLLKDIFRFQQRAYNENQIKARAHKRYVVGFKETQQKLNLGKIKLLIIAPDLEKSSEPGKVNHIMGGRVLRRFQIISLLDGIDSVIKKLKGNCDKFSVPFIFSMKRHQIGYVLLKKVPVSCVGLINYDGAEETAKSLLRVLAEERLRFSLETKKL